MATARSSRCLSGLFKVLLFNFVLFAAAEEAHWDKPVLGEAERRHLSCFMKSILLDEQSNGRLCCLPEEARTASCAVVGNSGSLLEHELGEEIDSHPIVIRLNDAPVKGFEKHVGSKFGFRFGWNVSVTHYLGEEEADEIYPMCQGPDEQRFQREHPKALSTPLRCDVGVISELFQSLYPGHLGSATATAYGDGSAGARAVMLALVSCQSVFVYGMTPSRSKTTPFAYYGIHSKTPGFLLSSEGLWKAEHDLWMRLASNSVADIMRSGYALFDGLQSMDDCTEATESHPGFASSWLKHVKHEDRDSFVHIGSVVTSEGSANHITARRIHKKKKNKPKKAKEAARGHSKKSKEKIPWPPPPPSKDVSDRYGKLRKELLQHGHHQSSDALERDV